MARYEKKASDAPAIESGTFCRTTMLVVRVESVAAREGDDLPEAERKTLLNELCDLLADPDLPDVQREAALALAGRIARRTVSDPACTRGLCEMMRRAAQTQPSKSRK